MEYNTKRNEMMLSEYGRNMQRMVEYVTSIEDEAKRNEQAKLVIEIMGQLNPHLKNVEDYRHKLWDHIVMMSDFKLVVDSPYPQPDKEEIFKKPNRIPYPQSEFKHKHYGKNVEVMIEKAKGMEDPEKQEAYTMAIGNYMKLVHANWSSESVTNETIVADLERMSGGVLKLPEETNLDLLGKPNRPTPRENSGGGGRRRGSNKGGGGKRNFKQRRKN